MTQISNQRTMVLAELSWSSRYSTYISLLFWLFLTSWSISLCVCLNNWYKHPGNPGTCFVIIYLQLCILTIVQLQLIAWLWNKKENKNLTIISEPQHFQNLGIFIFFILYTKCMQKPFTTKASPATLLFLWLLLQVIISNKTKQTPSNSPLPNSIT